MTRILRTLAALLSSCVVLAAQGQSVVSPAIAQVLANGSVAAIALQVDGKVVIGGSFTHVGGVARSNIARIDTDGSVDVTWNPNANGAIGALAIDGTGSIYAGGTFTAIGGQSRNNLAKLHRAGVLAVASSTRDANK